MFLNLVSMVFAMNITGMPGVMLDSVAIPL
jgi:hypothetical protein